MIRSEIPGTLAVLLCSTNVHTKVWRLQGNYTQTQANIHQIRQERARLRGCVRNTPRVLSVMMKIERYSASLWSFQLPRETLKHMNKMYGSSKTLHLHVSPYQIPVQPCPSGHRSDS